MFLWPLPHSSCSPPWYLFSLLMSHRLARTLQPPTIERVNDHQWEEIGKHIMTQEFYVVIEHDEDGFFVGEVPQLRACYAQGKTLDELMENIRKVIALCLEDQPISEPPPEFVGVQKVTI